VIGLISLDFTPAEIAETLAISPGTAKVHVRNILAKTGASSHRDAVGSPDRWASFETSPVAPASRLAP